MFGLPKKKKEIQIPAKVKGFLRSKEEEDLFNQVEEYNNYATYSLDGNSERSILNAMRDVPQMILDPICSSAVKCVMQTAFQSNARDELFSTSSPSSQIKAELDKFHEQINAKNFVLTTGYNCLLWGQLPWKHIYSKDGVLERVSPVPDFTSIVPIVVSGKTVGFLDENKEFVPSYMYTYAQLEYYKNLGGNQRNGTLTAGTAGTSKEGESFANEFSYADSYLSSASKAWRNVNVIEDGLLLNRMDQSNYYRIIKVNVGGQVYSKTAIQVLNYYRNLFKKVRRVNYDSEGMSSRGNGQEFEVIVPTTQNQGVDVTDVGGNVDVKSLRDLDVQYSKLFSALQLQPSQIGFSSDVPSSLGDSAANTWDKRFAKVCKTVSFSAYNALKNIDYLHLRSLGYNVSLSDWSYSTVSQTIQEDADKGESFNLAVESLEKVVSTFRSMDLDYDKNYLVKTVLGDSLGNYGVDCEKLLSKEDKNKDSSEMLLAARAKRAKNFKQQILSEDSHVMALSGLFTEETAKEITTALTTEKCSGIIKENVTPLTLKQVYSSFIVDKNNPLDLSNFVEYEATKNDVMKGWFSSAKKGDSQGMPFKFPIKCSEELKIVAGDLDECSQMFVSNLCVDEFGEYVLTSKSDLCAYLKLYMNGNIDVYCSSVLKK